jgi:hypothetical protein
MPLPALARRAGKTLLPAAAAALVTAAGFAAFTDDASNPGNRASAASVTITQDVPATAPLFDLSNWQPGEDDTVARCITVRNGGSIALPLRLRLDGAPTGSLGTYVDMAIERGTRPAGDGTSSCSGFAAAGEVWSGELASFPTAAGAGVADGGGALAPGADRAYRITWHLQDTQDAEGRSVADVDFLWETTSAD